MIFLNNLFCLQDLQYLVYPIVFPSQGGGPWRAQASCSGTSPFSSEALESDLAFFSASVSSFINWNSNNTECCYRNPVGMCANCWAECLPHSEDPPLTLVSALVNRKRWPLRIPFRREKVSFPLPFSPKSLPAFWSYSISLCPFWNSLSLDSESRPLSLTNPLWSVPSTTHC